MRKALITGSASGLAVAFARKLASLNFAIALNYRESKERCEQLAEQLHKEYGVPVITVRADITLQEDIHAMIDTVVRQFGTIDTLIHSAGPYIFERKRLTDYDDKEWHAMIDGNLSSAFHLFARVIPLMRPHGFGRIITVGFDRVEEAPGWVYRSAYAAAKVGLASLTRSVALEEQENGITANMICPGDIRGTDKEASLNEDALVRPMRNAVGADLANAVAFLVSEPSQFVTGNIINVAGEANNVITRFDHGKEDIFDPITLEPGTSVIVVPWQQQGIIHTREDRRNRRAIYHVAVGDTIERFTIDQLLEVQSHDF